MPEQHAKKKPIEDPTRLTFPCDRLVARQLKIEAKDKKVSFPEYLLALVMAGRKIVAK